MGVGGSGGVEIGAGPTGTAVCVGVVSGADHDVDEPGVKRRYKPGARLNSY